MAVYEASRTLDPEKRLIVLYWADNPGQTGTPAGHWLSIASQMVAQLGLDAERAAELFVVVSAAQADAFIASWLVKYETNVIRPITYINRVLDPGWRTDIITPPFPEYPSGHSVQSGAAAAVLTGLLGDGIAFDDSTNLAIGHPVRRFPSFWAAAEEAAISRLYGGIHYPMAISPGTEMGRCIGEKALQRLVSRPVP
jgi:membrane-associated phospholipid phosphatase